MPRFAFLYLSSSGQAKKFPSIGLVNICYHICYHICLVIMKSKTNPFSLKLNRTISIKHDIVLIPGTEHVHIFIAIKVIVWAEIIGLNVLIYVIIEIYCNLSAVKSINLREYYSSTLVISSTTSSIFKTKMFVDITSVDHILYI
uniref:Uncharacterized protein n=1 Tax=Glossina brevipalpis TaxID=37001 RepID=A0A1A9X3M8_9MUSC